MTHHAQDGRPGAKQATWALVGTCSAGALTMISAPWWVRVVCMLAGFAYGALRAVFPQRSADRLTWWTDRRQYRSRQHCQCDQVGDPTRYGHAHPAKPACAEHRLASNRVTK